MQGAAPRSEMSVSKTRTLKSDGQHPPDVGSILDDQYSIRMLCFTVYFQPNRTVSIETEPPSMPSTGKLTASSFVLAPMTYNRGR